MDWIGIEREGGFLGQRPEPLTDADFLRLARYVKNRYGLDLSGRKAMVESRLINYLMDRGFGSFSEYLRTIYDGGEEEAANLINRLTTNYTYFLREQEHYEHFMNTFLPAMKNRIRAGELCIWSAGCSFGNEAYTFAACMEDYVVADDRLGIDYNSGIDYSLAADDHVFHDGHVAVDNAAVADAAAGTDADVVPYPDLLSEVGAQGNAAGPAGGHGTVAAVFASLVGNELEQFGDRRVGVGDADHGGRHLCLGLKISVYQQDARLAGIHIFFVFGICVKAQRPRLPVFYLCKRADYFLGIAVHCTVKGLSYLFCA